MSKHVMDDAMRCLQCKNPKCSVGCPIHTPIRDAIRLLLDHETLKAGKLLSALQILLACALPVHPLSR
jgi:glutamate synthase (NADPH/NADH) small chain